VGIVLGAGLAVGLAAMAVQQGIRVVSYKGARKVIDDWAKDHPLDKIDAEKLFDAVNLGELSELARSFEKAWGAQQEFYRMAAVDLANLKKDVGDKGGTCFKAAEHAYRLLYWFKRGIRLFDERPCGDHRLRNVQLFVKLVPRQLFADAEVALAKYGRELVNFLAKHPQPASTGSAELKNDGFLRWADWAARWDQANPLGARVASLAEDGRKVGDPKRLVEKWGRLVQRLHTNGFKSLNDKERGELAKQAPGPGFVATARNQNLPPNHFAKALTIGKPVTVLVLKEALNSALLGTALSNGAAWATSGISAGVGGVASLLVSAFCTMAAETINSKENLEDIFNQNTNPAVKVRLIRDNLEAGGSTEVMYLRGRIEASIKDLEKQRTKLSPVWVGDDPAKIMVIELYRLHQYVVRLAVQSVLWELLLALILTWIEVMKGDFTWAYVQFETEMKKRLRDEGTGGYHKNCRSACYQLVTGLDNVTRLKDPLFRAW
jgi:hypothetical protein